MRPVDIAPMLEFLDLQHYDKDMDVSQYSAAWIYSWLESQPTIEQPTWISCAERLPAESGYYLVVYRDKFNGSELVSIDFYTKCAAGEWWDNDFGRTAIYWMPLPEPPKGVE